MSTIDKKIDEVIQQIASNHGIAVSKDDPIMILHTMNDRLISDSKAAQQELLDNFRSELEVIVSELSLQAKNHSDRILNTTLTTSKNEIARVMEEQSNIIIERWKADLHAEFNEACKTMTTSRQTAILNIIASFITLISAGIILTIFLTK
jgi:F0F1-type ATP synthase membrane subunit b/b'